MNSEFKNLERWKFGVLVILMAFSQNLAAQLNLTAGYEAVYGGTSNLNEILENFNREVEGADIKSINLQNGFSIGARYQFPIVTLNLAFSQTFNRRRAEDLFFRGEETDLSFSHGLATYMAGLEVGNTFIVGGTINYHRIRTVTDFSEVEETVLSNSAFGNRFYIGLQSGGDADISIAIKPFVQILWSDLDVQATEASFNPGGSEACFYCEEKKPIFLGISITLQNGRHRH